MSPINLTDRLLVAVEKHDCAWLHDLHGVGSKSMWQAKDNGYIEVDLRYREYTTKQGHFVTLTDKGKKRRAELLEQRRREHAKQTARKAKEMGACIVCGAGAQPQDYGCRCSDSKCIAHKTIVPEPYWRALRGAVTRLEQEADARVERAYEHPRDCRCRECYIDWCRE